MSSATNPALLYNTTEEEITNNLASADYNIKEGKYINALTDLEVTLEVIKDSEYNLSLREKYITSVERRAKRLSQKVTKIPHPKSSLLEDLEELMTNITDLEKDPHFSKTERTYDNVSITVIIILMIGGIFFLSTNITGNVIGNLNQNTSNLIGGILFILGLISAFLIFRKR